MQTSVILLNKELIEEHLKPQNKNMEIKIFEKINSTNEYLKQFFSHTMTSIVCLAEQQTQGKGRLGRNWHSPFGQNLYFSCLYTFQKNINELAGLSLVVSLAIIKTLQTYNLPELSLIKWPNDIIYQDKKLSGSLIETKIQSPDICHIIIGVGMNVNMIDDDNNISQAWTSLKNILGYPVDRNYLCAEFINHLLDYLKKFESQGLEAFISEWNKVDYLLDKKITLNSSGSIIEGIAKGINSQGQLLLQLDDGKIKMFSAGDATVVKK
jgi:BirA family biotin operon repressor/biotin-[acetyl-CoA-carboxylase] ligase